MNIGLSRPSARQALPLAVLAIALAGRAALILSTGFDGLYGQDAFAYYDYALQLRRALVALEPPPPFFWPLGYPALAVLVMAFAGPSPAAGQLASVAAGALAAPLTFALAREASTAGDNAVWLGAGIAGLLAALSAQLMVSSLSVMSDAAGLAWASLSAYALCRYARRVRTHWLAFAGLTLGLAMITRWVYSLLVVPWCLSALMAARHGQASRPQLAAAAGLSFIAGLTIVGCQLLQAARYGGQAFVGDWWIYEWQPAHAWQYTVRNADGVFHYAYPSGVYYALPAAHPAFVFPAFAPFFLVGLWQMRRISRAVAVLLLGWPAVMYVLLAGGAWQNPRFSLAYFPPLAVIAGLGVAHLWRTRARWRALLAIWCALGLAGSMAWTARDGRWFIARAQSYLLSAHWVEAHVPPAATVLAFNLTATLRHYTSLNVVELYSVAPSSLPGLVCQAGPAYAVLDTHNVATQWAGKSPQANFQWLEHQAGVRQLGRHENWTLFAIDRKACPDGAGGTQP